MIELNKIYNEDCLEGMQKIEDKSIDMILCDLPYGVLNKRNKWDSVIPFHNLWNEYKRIIKDNGAIVLFGQGMFTANCMKSNEDWWRYNLIWKKADRTSGFLNANRMPMRNHEDIMIFYNKQPIYHPQFEYGYKPSHKKGKNGVLNETNNCYGDFKVFETRDYGDRKFPKSVLNFDREHPPIHPTQKPVALCEWLIKTYTNEGETVLDNCIGSGTTAIACINTNRNYIGFELDKHYYEIAEERIQKAIADKPKRIKALFDSKCKGDK
jgi:site-specific DNA-methyltransferase (adenine-specific)